MLEDPTTRLKEAVDELRGLQTTYEDAKAQTSYARNQEADALNALNKQQKLISGLLAKIKAEAPDQSDWKLADKLK